MCLICAALQLFNASNKLFISLSRSADAVSLGTRDGAKETRKTLICFNLNVISQ